MSLLIIDDDEKLNRLLEEFLTGFGFDTVSVVHPADGLRMIKKDLPDLVILDVMLPEMNGFDVCKTIRRDYPGLPVIMLTARGEVTDRIVGLELGADDYLAKPFEPRELVARIQAVLRRSGTREGETVRVFDRLEIDFRKQLIRLDGETIPLTTNEFAALSLLAKHPGQVFDRDEIMQALRGMDWEAFNRSVDVTMSRLRQKLKDSAREPAFIKTVWGTGYVFIAKEGHDEA